MFGRGKWVNKVLIEGEKDAQLVSRIEGIPEVNPDFDQYPVDYKKPGRRSFWKALKVSLRYAKSNIYCMFYKDKRKNQGQAQEGA